MSIAENVAYKYRPYSARALEMLIRRELYFANPADLNDPYDCRINIQASLSAAINQADEFADNALKEKLNRLRKLDHVYDQMDKDFAALGVLSFSKDPTNTLMWSHYGDNHRGFCAGFQLSDKFTTHVNEEQIVCAIDVSYMKSNPFTEYFRKVAESGTPPPWQEFWMTLLSIGMVSKAEPWCYEKEVRVLRKHAGAVAFSPDELTEIVFGLDIPQPRRDTLRRVLSGSEWEHVRFREIVRSDGFELLIRNATYPLHAVDASKCHAADADR